MADKGNGSLDPGWNRVKVYVQPWLHYCSNKRYCFPFHQSNLSLYGIVINRDHRSYMLCERDNNLDASSETCLGSFLENVYVSHED